MSWFFDTILAGVSSFFSNGDKEKAKEEKKKRPVSEDDDGDADGASPATPPLRVTRNRRDSATKSALSVAVLQTMTPEARDAVILTMLGGCLCCNRTTLPARGRENEPRPTCV